MSETELHRKFGIGVAHFERVSVSHLGGFGACAPRKLLNLSPLKWLEMHLKLTWCGENYIHFQQQKTSP